MLPSQTFLRRFEPTVASAPTRSGLPYGKSDGKTSDQAFLNRAMVEAKSSPTYLPGSAWPSSATIASSKVSGV